MVRGVSLMRCYLSVDLNQKRQRIAAMIERLIIARLSGERNLLQYSPLFKQ